MRLRVSLIVMLIFLNFYIGYLKSNSVHENTRISVSGKPVKVVQSGNKCIIHLGKFVAHVNGGCQIPFKTKIKLSGRTEDSLIDNLQGKIVLVEVTLDELDVSSALDIKTEGKIFFGSKFIDYCTSIYKRYLPNEESGLVAGIVLGRRENIGRSFYETMIKSGTIHIAVASGYNVMLVGSVVLSTLFWLVTRKIATLGAIGAMIWYALLAGLEPPVIRAVIMASLVYWSQVQGRKGQTMWFLLLSIFLMLSWDLRLVSNPSFQLSVMASLGMAGLSPWVMRSSEGWKYGDFLRMLERVGIVTTTSTMILTLPVLWWHFGSVSFVSVLSNVFVVPLVPLVMVLGVGMLILPSIFFGPTYAVLHLMVRIIYFFGS